MKRLTTLLMLLLVIVACKEAPKAPDYKEETLDVTTTIYPDNVTKVFEAHGGIDTWNKYQGMYYEIGSEGVNEKHTIALKDRRSLIDAEHYLLGFDGKDVWLKEKDTVTYKSNAKFYYNLMFYFYAMPFVLGDDGVHYQEVAPLDYEGVSYPGIAISYDAGVGESPDDEYIVYYHPETGQMAWLAYTVTYFSKEKSKKFNLIKYDQWTKTNDLLLPSTLQWYVYKDGVVGELRNEMKFVNPKLQTQTPDGTPFKMPEGGKKVE